MTLLDISRTLNGKIICGESRLGDDIQYAFASDLMSDVLTLQTNKFVLLTGLVTLQTIRTAEMADIGGIVLVRNKKTPDEVLTLARENGIAIIECEYSMFKTCGLLFNVGINPVY